MFGTHVSFISFGATIRLQTLISFSSGIYRSSGTGSTQQHGTPSDACQAAHSTQAS